MRDPAPPYANEGPHALWHVSENPSIERFMPHVSADGRPRRTARLGDRHAASAGLLVPTRVPARDVLGRRASDPYDAARLLAGSSRVHAIEAAWLDRMHSTQVFAYRLPEPSFEPHPEVGGYWVSRETVEPARGAPLGDLVALHEDAAIELRVLPNLWQLWNDVATSTLEFSGVRLHNAQPAP